MPYKPTGRPNGRPKKVAPVEGLRPNLTEKQWAAVRFSASHPHASLAEIARAAKVSRQAVHQWQSNLHFQMARDWIEIQELSQALVERLAEGDARRKAAKDAAIRKYFGTKDFAFERLYWLVTNDYRSTEAKTPGSWSVVSMADGKTYTNPDEYIEHIRESGHFPTGHVSEADWEQIEQARRR